MLTNSSYNDSVHHPNNSVDVFISLYLQCVTTTTGSATITFYSVLNFSLHSGLSLFILLHGLQLYRKNPSTFSRTVSHSDCFTYHMAAMELIGALGSLLTCFGIHLRAADATLQAGVIINGVAWYGEMLFHILTCVERYLAVIHPVAYIRLRNQRWIRVRSISISCVWLLCFAGITMISSTIFPIINFCLLIISVVLVSFCSLSVLRVLVRPGPGDQSAGRERGDQSKRRAFYTISCILGMLFLRFLWGLSWAFMFAEGMTNCAMMTIDVWFNLPSSAVLQFLFLHRAGKLVCCKKMITCKKNLNCVQ